MSYIGGSSTINSFTVILDKTMKLRSGTRLSAGDIKNTIALRSGRRVRVTDISKPAPTKDVSLLRSSKKHTTGKDRRRRRINSTSERIVKEKKLLYPFTDKTVKLLKTVDPDIDLFLNDAHKGADTYISFYKKTKAPTSFKYIFIPNGALTKIIISGHLRVLNTGDSSSDYVIDHFMKAWRHLQISVWNLCYKGRDKERKRRVVSHTPFLVGLCYNALLVRENEPEFLTVWEGHANARSVSSDEHSLIQMKELDHSISANDFIQTVSNYPHLEMCQYWFRNQFRESRERVYHVLDQIYTFQQLIDDRVTIRRIEPLLHQFHS